MISTNLSEIPSVLIHAALNEIITNQLKTSEYSIEISAASVSGSNNFVGNVYRIGFGREDESYDENQNKQITQLILKVAPLNAARRFQYNVRESFLREIWMYNEVLPTFLQFERSRGVMDGFTEYPKCNGFVDAELNECIFFEDLSVRNFSTIDRHTEQTTADHVRLVMRTLGKYHAISFALKDQQPKEFERLASQMKEVFIRADDILIRKYLKENLQNVFDVLTDEEDANLLAKIRKLFEKEPADVAAECLDAKLTEGASVICHGDCWQNNIMFRCDDSGKPVEINLIDWQISRHSSPIVDIVLFMFSCTTKQLRDYHYNAFLKEYYEHLSAHIRRLGSDPDKLFPWRMFLEHLRKFAKIGLIYSTVLLPIITSDNRTAVDIDELCENIRNGTEFDAHTFVSKESVRKMNKRLKDVIVDMVRLEYI